MNEQTPTAARQIRDAFIAGAKSATVESPMYEDLWQAAIRYAAAQPVAPEQAPYEGCRQVLERLRDLMQSKTDVIYNYEGMTDSWAQWADNVNHVSEALELLEGFHNELPEGLQPVAQVKDYSVDEVRAVFGEILNFFWPSNRLRENLINEAIEKLASLSAKGEAVHPSEVDCPKCGGAGIIHDMEMVCCRRRDEDGECCNRFVEKHTEKLCANCEGGRVLSYKTATPKGEAPKEDAVQIKCCECGKVVPDAQMAEGGGAVFHFIPDTHFGPERSEWECASCAAPEGTVSAPVEEREGARPPFEKFEDTDLVSIATVKGWFAAAPSGVVEALRVIAGWHSTDIALNGSRVAAQMKDFAYCTLAFHEIALSAAPKEGEQSAPWVAEKIKDILNRHIIAQDGALVFGRLTATDELTRLFAAPKPNPEPLVAALRQAHWHGWFMRERYNGPDKNGYEGQYPASWKDMDYEDRHDWFFTMFLKSSALTQWEASQPSPDSTPKN